MAPGEVIVTGDAMATGKVMTTGEVKVQNVQAALAGRIVTSMLLLAI